jgi:hypothetical protein
MNMQPHRARLIGARPEEMAWPEVDIEAAAELIRRVRGTASSLPAVARWRRASISLPATTTDARPTVLSFC